jgi:hypothetical protein
MDSNDGYIKLETTQDKVRKLWAKIAVRAREQAFVQQVLAKKRREDAQEIKK